MWLGCTLALHVKPKHKLRETQSFQICIFFNDITKWILVRTHKIDPLLGWDHSLRNTAPRPTCHDHNRSWYLPLEKGTGWLRLWGAGIFIVSAFMTLIFVWGASAYSINTSYFESFWQSTYFLILTCMALKNQRLGPAKVSCQWICFVQVYEKKIEQYVFHKHLGGRMAQ